MHAQNLPTNNQPTANQMGHPSPTSAPSRGSKIAVLFGIAVVLFVLQLVTLYLVVNPPYLAQQNLTRQVIDEVSQMVEVNPFETPIVSVVADAESLRSANNIQGDVYANAQDGDYVLGFSDKMVIYRRETGEVVYEGESPGSILNKNQQNLRQSVINAAQTKGLIPEGEEVNPQMSVVTDPAVLRSQDASFYANVQEGDVIAVFPSKQLIVLVRANESGTSVIQSGSYTTSINSN
ncbi:MAG: hypothetical protein ACE5DX_00200 [Candidatus Dojkabacteria bacterium]